MFYPTIKRNKRGGGFTPLYPPPNHPIIFKMTDKEKRFCFICGTRIKDNLYNNIVYPADEYKEGHACFFCSKKKREQNIAKNSKTKPKRK